MRKYQPPNLRPLLRLLPSCLCLALFSFSFSSAKSQYEGLLNMSYAQRQKAVGQLSDSIFYQPDSTKAYKMADELISFWKKQNNDSLVLHFELYKLYHLSQYSFSKNQERILQSVEAMIKKASRLNLVTTEASARTFLADIYWGLLRNYERSLLEFHHVDRIIRPLSVDIYPEKTKVSFLIGNAYFYFRDYKKAIAYFKAVPKVKHPFEFQRFSYIHSLNRIAVSYRELGLLDSSDYYCRLLYQHSEEVGDSAWMDIVNGDLGYNGYLRGHYTQALPLLQKCTDCGIRLKDWGLAAGSLMTMADIYFKENNTRSAITATLQAKDFVERSGQYHRYRYLYPLLSKMYTTKGNPVLSGRYIDSTIRVMDSLHNEFSGLTLARALQKEAITQQSAKLADIENKKQLLSLKFYAFLMLAFILFIAGLYIYRTKRLQHRQQQALKDLQLKEATSELQHAQEQLKDFARHIAEKNKLIETMEEQFGSTKNLEELEKSIILTDADWRRFRELFEQVHPGYLQRLAEKIPGISPAEVRLMALSKLNFSNKEMAAALGITPQAIRVNWHRLRKKLELPEDGTIEELINLI